VCVCVSQGPYVSIQESKFVISMSYINDFVSLMQYMGMYKRNAYFSPKLAYFLIHKLQVNAYCTHFEDFMHMYGFRNTIVI
jgi:hypothetical protein